MNKTIIIFFLALFIPSNGMNINKPIKKEHNCSEVFQNSHKLVSNWFIKRGMELVKSFDDVISNSKIEPNFDTLTNYGMIKLKQD
jgi:hypothetical protein